jgi:hypothetical protein
MVHVERGKSFEILIERSPLLVGLFPQSGMANVGVRGASDAVSRVAWSLTRFLYSSILSTDVSHEICPTVQHPLDMLGARLRSFRSASFRNGPGCSSSSCVGGVCDVNE